VNLHLTSPQRQQGRERPLLALRAGKQYITPSDAYVADSRERRAAEVFFYASAGLAAAVAA